MTEESCGVMKVMCSLPAKGSSLQEIYGVEIFFAGQKRQCAYCGKVFSNNENRVSARMRRFCSRSCSAQWRMRDIRFREKVYTPERNQKLSQAIKQHYADHPEYAEKIAKSKRGRPLSEEHKEKIRIKNSLPEKVAQFKSVRSGNGYTIKRQERLREKIQDFCLTDFTIGLGKPRQKGYPTCYKVDVGFPEIKIAIEIDGGSHNTLVRQAQDLKKKNKLEELGWKILRFTNRQIDALINGEIQMVEYISTILRQNGITLLA